MSCGAVQRQRHRALQGACEAQDLPAGWRGSPGYTHQHLSGGGVLLLLLEGMFAGVSDDPILRTAWGLREQTGIGIKEGSLCFHQQRLCLAHNLSSFR